MKVPKVVHLGGLKGLVLGAILQNFISLSIQRVRSSFFVQIEAEVKNISHKKLISKSDLFEGMCLVSKRRLKSQHSRLGIESQVQMPRTGRGTILYTDEIGQVQCGSISH